MVEFIEECGGLQNFLVLQNYFMNEDNIHKTGLDILYKVTEEDFFA